MDICTFWYGKSLRLVDRLCLSSMVMTGQKVKLFTHGEVDNVPQGVEVHDAEPILPLSIMKKLDPEFPSFNPAITIVQFSDLFRVLLMKRRQGIWLDTDVYLAKPLNINENEPWLARENHSRLGVSALYLPADNPIIGEFERYLSSGEVVPPWLGFKRRIGMPIKLTLTKQPVRTNRLGITVFGNDGISRLAKKYKFFYNSHPKQTFYYWTARHAARIFEPAFGLEPLNDPRFIGFHIHRKALTTQPPRAGSFYEWAVKRLNNFHDFDTIGEVVYAKSR